MSRLHTLATVFSTVGLLLSTSGAAWADAPPPETTPPAPAPAATTSPKLEGSAEARPTDDPFRSIAITANPLSLALTRIGLNVEWLPTTHHALVLNPFGQFISTGTEGSLSGKTSYSNFGAELGYRFYTGSRGANGFFVGPFVTALSSSATTTATINGTKNEASSNFVAYGGGLDLGGQHVFQNGVTIGGGFGLMYLAGGADKGASSSTVKFEGVLPRFLFTAGYSF